MIYETPTLYLDVTQGAAQTQIAFPVSSPKSCVRPSMAEILIDRHSTTVGGFRGFKVSQLHDRGCDNTLSIGRNCALISIAIAASHDRIVRRFGSQVVSLRGRWSGAMGFGGSYGICRVEPWRLVRKYHDKSDNKSPYNKDPQGLHICCHARLGSRPTGTSST